jgi:predicted NAD/FAD-dependent oxidoreductase
MAMTFLDSTAFAGSHHQVPGLVKGHDIAWLQAALQKDRLTTNIPLNIVHASTCLSTTSII